MKIRTKLVVAFMTTALIPTAILSYFAAVESLEQSRAQYSEHAHQNMSLLDSTFASFSAFVERDEWRYVSEVDFQADPDVPKIKYIVGDINQSVLNIIIKAAHAIGARRAENGDEELGRITISTGVEGNAVLVRVRDDGVGIAKENLHRVFDPFFTTKDVGKGRGQGLAVVFRSIVDIHGGNVDVVSKPNESTKFTISLPINADEPDSVDAEPAAAVAHA